VARGLVNRGGDHIDDKETKRGAHQGLPAAETVDDLRRETSGQTVLGQRQVAGSREENGGVGGHSGDIGLRGYDLEPNAEPSTATKVLSGATT
jgi:hypothetical protein